MAIELTVRSNAYGNNKQYIARIIGKSAKFGLDREFVGRKDDRITTAYLDEPGLYEDCDISNKGKKEIGYAVVLPRTPNTPKLRESGDDEFLFLRLTEPEALAVAKRIGAGEHIESIIEVTHVDGENPKYVASVRNKTEARQAAKAITIQSAVDVCMAVLGLMSEKEQKAVMKELKVRLNPPKPLTEPEAVGQEGSKNEEVTQGHD